MISIADAKAHLRVVHTDEDADIAAKLQLAQSIVAEYIGDNAPLSATQQDVTDAATLLILGELYANREAASNPLSPTVRMLLERLRVPAIG